MRIAVAGLKGGAAKTTTAIYLAECAYREGPTLLVDTDQQESAYTWAERAYGENGPTLAKLTSTVIHQEVDRLRSQFQHVVIDTAPGMRDLDVVRSAMAAAELVVMPVAPSMVEIDRVIPTWLLAQQVHRPAVVVIVKHRETRIAREVEEALEVANVPLLDASVPLRTGLEAAFGSRPTDMYGYDTVWQELKEIVEALND